MIRVYGDIMLDEWIYGEVNRISPEAPVPVVKEMKRTYNAGGAANLAVNISSLGSSVNLYGAISDDDNGKQVLSYTSKFGVTNCVSLDHSVTTTKTRIVDATGHHIARLDREEKYKNKTALEKIIDDVEKTDLICISDYDKGTIDRSTIARLRKYCNKILVDPKQDPIFYKNVWLFKPNIKYWQKYFGEFNTDQAFAKLNEYGWKNLIITCGADGLYVFKNNGEWQHFSEPVREVADVTGAGDTVLAVITHCINEGLDIFKSAQTACYAAARTVEKQGVVHVTPNDINRGVVFTNGVFDILHKGHLELLKNAKGLGNKLIVGINSDSSVKRLKGDTRPINNEIIRKSQLESLPWVDQVHIFEDDTPYNLIKSLNPDLIVKGGDYTPETVVGNDLSPVYIVPTVEGFSTTKIIESTKQ